jgi:hypothetical protein
MSTQPSAWKRRLSAILAEPTFHFFVLGALLFGAHRLIAGDPRLVSVTPGVKDEIARRFRDTHEGRAPTPAELDKEVQVWERDEALYREALRAGLDRHDATIRTVLVDRMRARAALALPKPTPTAAELEQWLAAHRSLYEVPRRFDYGVVTFPKSRPTSAAELDKYQRDLKQGADPRTLGRPIVGGNLTDDDLKARLGSALAPAIERLPIGRWQRLESPNAFLLARLDGVAGGLPSVDALRAQLTTDWAYAERRRQVDRAVQVLVDRYRFREQP